MRALAVPGLLIGLFIGFVIGAFAFDSGPGIDVGNILSTVAGGAVGAAAGRLAQHRRSRPRKWSN